MLTEAQIAILSRVSQGPGGCWLWRLRLDASGGGKLIVGGHNNKVGRAAHVASYEAFVGPIPLGAGVFQSCGVRCCVAPAHLVALPRSAGRAALRAIARPTPSDAERRAVPLPPSFVDITGCRFGRLTVLAARDPGGRWGVALCRCDCGEIRSVERKSLRAGRAKSCGCSTREEMASRSTTHGWSRTPEYRAWIDLRRRCGTPTDPYFSHYGARGIRVCIEWQESFDAFLRDMGPRPGPRYSIDRVDNDGNYEPGNCRWATVPRQNRNKRCTRWITIAGDKRALADWAEIVGLKPTTILQRIRAGWDHERAVLAPVGAMRRVA